MKTGQPDTDRATVGQAPPPLPQPVAAVLSALSAVMILSGGVIAVTGPPLPRLSLPRPARVVSAGQPPAQPLPVVPVPASSPAPLLSPTGPDQLAALDESTAEAELQRQADTDAGQIAALAGSWVPQVSSKCVGIRVDIGPNWVPDGFAETGSVTTAQIAAFHAALRDRFGALTARPTAVGIARDEGTRGACQGLLVWLSLVPQTYASPASANAWCDAQALPVQECGARFIEPGGGSKYVARS